MNANKLALDALIAVRDADDDCIRDGLPHHRIPVPARTTIDAAIARMEIVPDKLEFPWAFLRGVIFGAVVSATWLSWWLK